MAIPRFKEPRAMGKKVRPDPYPKGQCQVIYIRKKSGISAGLGPDPTMSYVADDEFENAIQQCCEQSYRWPDEIQRPTPAIARLIWFENPSEWTTQPK